MRWESCEVCNVDVDAREERQEMFEKGQEMFKERQEVFEERQKMFEERQEMFEERQENDVRETFKEQQSKAFAQDNC
jgi:hypothetical protein